MSASREGIVYSPDRETFWQTLRDTVMVYEAVAAMDADQTLTAEQAVELVKRRRAA